MAQGEFLTSHEATKARRTWITLECANIAVWSELIVMEFTESGLIFENGIVLHWSDVEGISYYKIDAIFQDMAYLVFDLENGQFIEVDSEQPDFDHLIIKVFKQFELSEDLLNSVTALGIDDEPLQLWKKHI